MAPAQDREHRPAPTEDRRADESALDSEVTHTRVSGSVEREGLSGLEPVRMPSLVGDVKRATCV